MSKQSPQRFTAVTILSSVHDALDTRVFYREARSLHQDGYKVTLIAVHDRDEQRDGISILGLPCVPRWRRPLLWITLFRRALKTQADIYHYHDPELLLIAPFLRLLSGKPTIYDIHEVYPDFIEVKEYIPAWLRRPLASFMRRLEPWLAGHESGLIFSDNEIARPFRPLDTPQVTLFNYPDLETFPTPITTTTKMSWEPTIIYLGGLERNRGAFLMLEAFRKVKDQLPEAHLLLVGHYAPVSLREEMVVRAAELDLTPSITMTGRVPFDSLGDYLGRSNVGWIPWQAYSKNDKNIPTKLFEYMASSLPVVSSDLSSTRPYIENGINGYLVSPADPTAHATAILELLQNPEMAIQMGHKGRELIVSEYNWSRMEDDLRRFYQELWALSGWQDSQS